MFEWGLEDLQYRIRIDSEFESLILVRQPPKDIYLQMHQTANSAFT